MIPVIVAGLIGAGIGAATATAIKSSNDKNKLEKLPTRTVNEEDLPPSIRAKMKKIEQKK